MLKFMNDSRCLGIDHPTWRRTRERFNRFCLRYVSKGVPIGAEPFDQGRNRHRFMARRDVMNISRFGTPMEGINLDFRVGLNAENRIGDVLAVQTLFRYIGLDAEFKKRFLGDMTIPKSDGICGSITLRAIRHFQRKNAGKLIRVDGVIHPASYKGRMVDYQKPLMTITLLHLFAWEAMGFQPDVDYVDGLIRIQPNVAHYLMLSPQARQGLIDL